MIPESAEHDRRFGVVLAIGPGQRLKDGSRHPMGVGVGDQVLLQKYSESNVPIEIDGEDGELCFVREEFILAVVTEQQGG